MDDEKKIEIPFGAFDSELIHQEISIPDGFKAIIDGNKIILTRIESEDERIRKEIIDYLKQKYSDPNAIKYDYHKWITWLEKQDEKLPAGFYYVNSEGEKFYSDTFKYGNVTLHVEKQGKPIIEMKSPEESLGISSKEYNDIVNDCLYGEQKPTNSYCQEHCKGFQETGKCFADGDCKDKREAERKSAWSEEDEEMLADAYIMLDWYKGNNWWTAQGIKDWLKELKQRIGG